MTDIDFDELDRAVNSLMNQRQQNSDSAQQTSTSESTVTSEEKSTPESVDTQPTAAAAAVSDQTPAIGPMPSAPQDTPAFVAQSPDSAPAITPEPAASTSGESSAVTAAPEQQSPTSEQSSTVATATAETSEPVAHDGASFNREQRQTTSDNEGTAKTMPEPIVPKRTGRIMDVMPPSPGSAAAATPIISRAETAAVINRTNAAVDTMVTSVTPHTSDDKPGEVSEKPEADIAKKAPAAQPVASGDATTATPSMTEAIAQSLADSAQSSADEPQAAGTETPQQEQTESLESPFLSNTIIKKRPLGAHKDDTDHTEQALAGMLDLASSDGVAESPTEDSLDDTAAPAAKPRLELTPSSEAIAAVEDAPVESSDLDRELMALEMGIVSDLAEAADTQESGVQSTDENAPVTTNTTPEASDIALEPAPAFPAAPDDIAEGDTVSSAAQTLESAAQAETPSVEAASSTHNEVVTPSATPGVSSTAPEPVPMFDVAATQPQPMEEKKTSGFLTFIIVLILLLLGAGGGAAAYYFLLVQ